MRDWVIALILLLILVIVFDGIRRWRKTRRENIQLSRNAKRADKQLGGDKILPSEFPRGGARVIKQRAPEDIVSINSSLRESFETSRLTAGARNRIPQQVTLKLDEATPVPVDKHQREKKSQQVEPTIQADTCLEELEHIDDSSEQAETGRAASKRGRAKPPKRDQPIVETQTSFWGLSANRQAAAAVPTETALDSDKAMEDAAVPAPSPSPSKQAETVAADDSVDAEAEVGGPASNSVVGREEVQAQAEVEPDPDPEPEPEHEAEPESQQEPEREAEPAPEPEQKQQEEEFIEPEEVLIINVTARRGELFHGSDLLNALMQLDMKFGEMDIFHRHINEDGSGPVLFSLANMVMPGTFNLAAMQNFSTPGLSLFLSLPLPASLEAESESAALDAYNILAYTAQGLSRALDGQLKDENRSVMTLQTIEHGRQRVIEYQRKRRVAHR